MSINPRIDSEFSGSIVGPDGIDRSYNSPEGKERIEKLNKLVLKIREQQDFEMAKKNQGTWNQNPHRETRYHKFSKYSSESWLPGSNNAYTFHRSIDPFDRGYQRY